MSSTPKVRVPADHGERSVKVYRDNRRATVRVDRPGSSQEKKVSVFPRNKQGGVQLMEDAPHRNLS